MSRICFSMRHWKSGPRRAFSSAQNLGRYVIRNLDGTGSGCICGRSARSFRGADEICTALELRTHLADLQSDGNGRPALDAYDLDRATFGRSVFTYSSACARSHRRIWTVLGNWISARRTRNESCRDRPWNGDHPGSERVIGIADPINHSPSSTVGHASRPYLPGWNCDHAGRNRTL